MPHSEYDTEPKIDTSVIHGDWRDDLFRDGYYVVKGVLSTDKAQFYVDRMFNWLESFPYGFKKDDPSTWNPQYLPDHIKYETSPPQSRRIIYHVTYQHVREETD